MKVCPSCGFENDDKTKFCNECGTRLETTKDPFIGTTIDQRYEVLEKIDRGGMGTVYKAKHSRIDKDIALKILHPVLAQDEKLLKRFESEAKTVAKLRHESIVQVHDTGPVRDTYYIAMDFIKGESLLNLIKKRAPLSVEEALSIALQVAEGLAYAHDQKILHRDIKPANIIVDKKGKAIITDFGIAKAIGEKGQTTTGATIGTPEYMSFEQLKGYDLDGRTDVYSLGIVLYEMLTGKSPFRTESGVSVIGKVLTEEAEPIEDLRSDLPKDVIDIVNKAIVKDRDKRFRSAAEFASALRKGLNEGSEDTIKVKVAEGKEETVKVTTKLDEITKISRSTEVGKYGKHDKKLIRFFIISIVFLVSIFFITNFSFFSKYFKAVVLLDRGKDSYDKENFEEAIEYFTEVIDLRQRFEFESIAIRPKFEPAYNYRGSAYHKLEKYENARDDFTEAIKLDPNCAMYYYYRGNAYSELEKYEDAIADFTEAIKLDPNCAIYYINRSCVYDELGKYDDAISDYTKAIEIDPNYIKVH